MRYRPAVLVATVGVLLLVIMPLTRALLVKYVPYQPATHSSDSVARLWDYHGREYDECVSTLGPPAISTTITLDEAQSEFRIELQNWYPPSRIGNRLFVRFIEATWHYGNYSVTLWFHRVGNKWICLDSVRYLHTIRF